MSDLRINNITDRTGDSGPVFAGISTVSTTGSFVVPVGDTAHRGGRGRMIIAGGSGVTMNYLTIATAGNALDFGDLKVARRLLGACSSPTRVVFGGGRGQHPSPGTYHDEMDYVQIMSTGNATDFGNLVSTLNTPKGTSNGHGGLG